MGQRPEPPRNGLKSNCPMKNQSDSAKIVAAQRQLGLSRRHFLRGIGACLALPAFESFAPWKTFAADSPTGKLAATPAGAPLRSAFIYFPNGAIPAAWWPTGDETGYTFNRTL